MNAANWHSRISLAALCALVILPFLNPYHFNPIPTFYQELTAAACGLLAATLLLRKAVMAQLEIPTIALIPLGLGGLLLIQFAFGLVAFIPQALVFLLYLLWGLLIVTLGRSLRQQFRLETLATLLATSLLCGALLSSVLLTLQLFAPDFGSGWVFHYVRGSGNLGQANHLADYLWLGIASAIYLHIQSKVGGASFWLCALALISAASLTGSRSVILYAIGFALLALWAARQFRQSAQGPALRRIVRVALLLLPTTIALQFVLTHIDFGDAFHTTVSGDRFFQVVSGPSQRLQLWRTALEIYAQHPWLGAGIGQFPVNAYLVVGAQPDGTYLGGGEHAHNIFLHLLSEFGLAAPLLVALLSLHWWLRFIRQAWSPAHWWIAAVLLVLGTHSQLEYPLWYSFFLGIAALLLGMGSDTGTHPRITGSSRALVALVLLLGSITLGTLTHDYRQLERTLNWRPDPTGNRPTLKATLESLAKLQRESLFAPYVDLTYAYQLSVDREQIKDKITVSEIAIRFSPVDLITYKLAYLLALDGQEDAAKVALQRALATHPGFIPKARLQLRELSADFPELKLLQELLPASADLPEAEPSGVSAQPVPSTPH